MTWKPIDFQGIVKLSQPLIDQLTNYLREKESQLGTSITDAMTTLPQKSLPPSPPFVSGGVLKLSDAVDVFAKHVREVASSSESIVSEKDWVLTSRKLNTALWEYAEILEGCITELFQQLKQIGYEEWHAELRQVVDRLKDILMQALDDLSWSAQRLEGLLWEYRYLTDKRAGKWVQLTKLSHFWTTLLDRSLFRFVNKSKKYLENHYEWFIDRYEAYFKLNTRVQRSLKKFDRYQTFQELEEGDQAAFLKVYRHLKLWVYNEKSQALPRQEPVRALRSAFSIDKVNEVYHTYYAVLKEALFERSRKFKEKPKDIYSEPGAKKLVGEVIEGYRKELHTLGATIGKYREFFLKSHPNPYVRARWGFVEWVVGPEPKAAKELLHLMYRVEKVDELFGALGESLEAGPQRDAVLTNARQYREVERCLHELGQPLTSRGVLRQRAERLLELIQELNELGSFQLNVVEQVEQSLSKAMRADWQYHVLFEFSLFHQLIEVHRGIVGEIEDRQYLSRSQTFKRILAELKSWVVDRTTHRHVHEIEQDMNDIKATLQDFLAFVQRIAGDKMDEGQKREAVRSISHQLLEYRYLFGQFFHQLHQYEPDGKLIRNQFLFVDQYFETVENLLHELRS